MPNPRLGPRFTIYRCLLNVHILVCRVEVDRADCCRLTRHGVLDANFLEKRRIDEINILSGHREQSHNGEEEKCSHGSRVIIAGKPSVSVIERRWNVLVNSFRRQARPTGVVIEVNRQEDWFVGNVCQAALVKKVEARNEFIIPADE